MRVLKKVIRDIVGVLAPLVVLLHLLGLLQKARELMLEYFWGVLPLLGFWVSLAVLVEENAIRKSRSEYMVRRPYPQPKRIPKQK